MPMFDKQSAGPQPASSGEARKTSYKDPFERVGDADAREGGVYIIPGLYPVLYVDVIKMIVSRKGQDLFIAEFDIISSDVEARPTGTRVSWIVNFAHEPAPGNVKAFLAAVMNVNPDEVDKEGAQFACSDDNPCRGRLVRCQASETTTKAGKPFTTCTWVPIPDEKQEQAEKLRTQAGFDDLPF